MREIIAKNAVDDGGIESCIKRYKDAERSADDKHWDGCEAVYDASQLQMPKSPDDKVEPWVVIMSKETGKSIPQVYNKKNAWSFWLLVKDFPNALETRNRLYFSHYCKAYKYRDKTDLDDLVDMLDTAAENKTVIAEFAGLIEERYGDKEPHEKYYARFKKFHSELNYLYKMSEANSLPQNIREKLLALKKALDA